MYIKIQALNYEHFKHSVGKNVISRKLRIKTSKLKCIENSTIPPTKSNISEDKNFRISPLKQVLKIKRILWCKFKTY
jgi:hypothetical protein